MTKVFKNIPKPVLFICSLVLLLYLSFWLFMFLIYDDWTKSGSLGDTFGILNALLSSIGTIGIIYTLYIQNKTIKSQDQILELQAQTLELSIKPLLEIKSKRVESNFILVVRNIGNGTAINIEFPPAISSFTSYRTLTDYTFNLIRDAEVEVEIGVFDVNGKIFTPIFDVVSESFPNPTIDLIVEYQDVNFKKWKQKFKFGQDGNIIMAKL